MAQQQNPEEASMNPGTSEDTCPQANDMPERDATLKRFDPTELAQKREEQFPMIFELFRRVGIHMSQAEPPINPYTGVEATESFTNIGEHCVSVSLPVEKLMNALQSNDVVTELQTEYAIGRGLLHDASKPYEIMRKIALKEGIIDDAYSAAAYDTLQPLLTELNFDEKYIEYLKVAGKETGHLSLAQFITVDENYAIGLAPGMYPEKVVHLADDMTFTSIPVEGELPTTKFLTVEERMEASDFPNRYPWLWQEGLGVNSNGEIVPLKNISEPGKDVVKVLGSYAELQVLVAELICDEMQALIDPMSDRDPATFIKELVNS